MGGAYLLLLSLAACCSCEYSIDVVSQLQVDQRKVGLRTTQLRSAYNRSIAKRANHAVVLSNNLYWQGYGNPMWSYFVGFLGQDQVSLGGVVGNAKVGLNMIGNAPLGNMFQSVSTDSGMLGLLPGCFSDQCRGPEDYDDLLSTLARQGKIQRAFTMCFHDGPEGGGKLYLGKPEVPNDATIISLVPLTNGQSPYSPLSTFDGNSYVEFYFGHVMVGSKKVMEWNNMMENFGGYSDTGTPGLMLPSNVYMKIFDELRNGLATDEQCFSLWGYSLQKLQTGGQITVSEVAAECAKPYLKDFEVKLGPGVSITVSKSSFFYETEPCSKQYGISWVSSGSESMIFGTALNYGKSILYDTTDLSAPKMVVLGPAGGCSRDYAAAGAKPLVMKGVPGQVLGRDGTITTDLTVGTPGQEITAQLDTGSQKFMGIHQTCRNLGNCFLVQPVDGKNTALLPGRDFATATCQAQMRDVSRALAQKSCQKVHGKTLCECSSQEECLSLIMQATSQNVVPHKICAIGRKICGDRVDFEPEHSSTFQPSHFPSYPFLKPPGKQRITAQCHLTHLCARGKRGKAYGRDAMGPSDDSDDRDEGYRDEEDEGPDRDGDDRDDSGSDGYDSGYDGYDSGYDGYDGSSSGSGYDDDDYDYSNSY